MPRTIFVSLHDAAGTLLDRTEITLSDGHTGRLVIDDAFVGEDSDQPGQVQRRGELQALHDAYEPNDMQGTIDAHGQLPT